MRLITKTLTLAAGLGLLTVNQAMAMTPPVSGDFAYDLYDIGVNQILLGAPGFVGAVLLMVYSGTLLMRNWVLGVAGILAGTILINADSITASMGMVI